MNQKQEDRVIGVLNAWADESDVAVAQYYGERSRDVDMELYHAIYDLVEAVEDKEIDAGAVPQKSVITGTFEKALNAYYRGNVHVAGKEIITFGYNIGGISDAKIESIEEVIGSEEALSQSSQWLTENLPNARRTAVNTPYWEAGRICEEGNLYSAVIGTENGFRDSGLTTLLQTTENLGYNQTTFGIIKPGHLTLDIMPEPTGNDRSLIIVPTSIYSDVGAENYAGILDQEGIGITDFGVVPVIPARNRIDGGEGRQDYLNKILEVGMTMIRRGVSTILAEPVDLNYVEFKGHLKNNKVKDAVNVLYRQVDTLKLVGTYPTPETYETGR